MRTRASSYVPQQVTTEKGSSSLPMRTFLSQARSRSMVAIGVVLLAACAPEGPETPNSRPVVKEGSPPPSPPHGGPPLNGSPSPNASPQTVTFSSSTEWIVPAGITSVTVELWGGQGKNGGGGGAYVKKKISVVKDMRLKLEFNPAAGGPGASVRLGSVVAGGGSAGADCPPSDSSNDPYIPPDHGGATNALTTESNGKGGIASGGDENVNGGDSPSSCDSAPGKSADPGERMQKAKNSTSWGAEAWITW